MKEFKIRCSQIGQIMADPRSKADKDAGILSKTAQSYCDMWIKEQIYNRKKEIDSKFTRKGNMVEDSSIDFISLQLGYPMLFKNEEFFEDNIMHGTPDVLPPDNVVIDAKNSWDWSTFPLMEADLPNKDYWWQGQGYMHLTGRTNYKVCYVLSDTPIDLIEREAFWYCKNNGFEDLDIDVYKDFEQRMTYPDLDDNLKFKCFEFKYDKSAIDAVQKRVMQCRAYVSKKLEQILKQKEDYYK